MCAFSWISSNSIVRSDDVYWFVFQYHLFPCPTYWQTAAERKHNNVQLIWCANFAFRMWINWMNQHIEIRKAETTPYRACGWVGKQQTANITFEHISNTVCVQRIPAPIEIRYSHGKSDKFTWPYWRDGGNRVQYLFILFLCQFSSLAL